MSTLITVTLLAKQLRELNAAWSHEVGGGEYVSLVREVDGDGTMRPPRWLACCDHEIRILVAGPFGLEWVPGNPRWRGATAAARRLLAATRDGSELYVVR